MNTDLVLGAGACFAFGALLDVYMGPRWRATRCVPYVMGLAGSGCMTALGIQALAATGRPEQTRLFGLAQGLFVFDHLAGLFLVLLFSLASAISAFAISWSLAVPEGPSRGIAAGYLVALGSVGTVLVSTDIFTFLFAWEMLTFAFYALTAASRSTPTQPRAAWLTLGVGKISGAALLLALLLLAAKTGNLDFEAWHGLAPGAYRDVAWLLLVVGFGAKVGLAPFQLWLPVGYPAAPGPSRAMMAGVAANVGIYGLWRSLAVLGAPPPWLAVVVLLVGGVTALLGITFAGVQRRLSRVVAYSSVENAGLIVTAYGVALSGAASGHHLVEALGLLAATLQTVAHAIAKSTLFCALANIELACGTDDLELTRGVGRELKWTGASFGAGAVALAGLPPTIGFVSEWFILEALMQQFRLGGLELTLALAAAGAAVALTTGLAALAFLRVLGITIIGAHQGPKPSGQRDARLWGKAALVVLGIGCTVLGALTPLEVRFITCGLSGVVPRSEVLASLKSAWVLQPVFQGFSILSPSWLWVAMPVAVLSVLLMALLLSGGRFLKVRRAPAWHSASAAVSGPVDYSAFGFANPLRHVLGNLLGTQRSVGPVTDADEMPEGPPYLESKTSVTEPVEAYIYRPVVRGLLWSSAMARRLQSGRLNAYVAYMFLALLGILALAAALR